MSSFKWSYLFVFVLSLTLLSSCSYHSFTTPDTSSQSSSEISTSSVSQITEEPPIQKTYEFPFCEMEPIGYKYLETILPLTLSQPPNWYDDLVTSLTLSFNAEPLNEDKIAAIWIDLYIDDDKNVFEYFRSTLDIQNDPNGITDIGGYPALSQVTSILSKEETSYTISINDYCLRVICETTPDNEKQIKERVQQVFDELLPQLAKSYLTLNPNQQLAADKYQLVLMQHAPIEGNPFRSRFTDRAVVVSFPKMPGVQGFTFDRYALNLQYSSITSQGATQSIPAQLNIIENNENTFMTYAEGHRNPNIFAEDYIDLQAILGRSGQLEQIRFPSVNRQHYIVSTNGFAAELKIDIPVNDMQLLMDVQTLLRHLTIEEAD